MRKKAIQLALVGIVLSGMLGCSTFDTQKPQLITKTMTIVPPKPTAPDPESADQRDVALYIVNLRGWGDAMAIKLKAIADLIQDE